MTTETKTRTLEDRIGGMIRHCQHQMEGACGECWRTFVTTEVLAASRASPEEGRPDAAVVLSADGTFAHGMFLSPADAEAIVRTFGAGRTVVYVRRSPPPEETATAERDALRAEVAAMGTTAEIHRAAAESYKAELARLRASSEGERERGRNEGIEEACAFVVRDPAVRYAAAPPSVKRISNRLAEEFCERMRAALARSSSAPSLSDGLWPGNALTEADRVALAAVSPAPTPKEEP